MEETARTFYHSLYLTLLALLTSSSLIASLATVSTNQKEKAGVTEGP